MERDKTFRGRSFRSKVKSWVWVHAESWLSPTKSVQTENQCGVRNGVNPFATARTFFRDKLLGIGVDSFLQCYGSTCCSNQNQIWRVNIGEYKVFAPAVGSDYWCCG